MPLLSPCIYCELLLKYNILPQVILLLAEIFSLAPILPLTEKILLKKTGPLKIDDLFAIIHPLKVVCPSILIELLISTEPLIIKLPLYGCFIRRLFTISESVVTSFAFDPLFNPPYCFHEDIVSIHLLCILFFMILPFCSCFILSLF